MNRLSVVSLALLVAVATIGCALPAQADRAAPSISSVSPSSVVASAQGFTLNVFGSNFTGNCVVLWNGSPRPTVTINSNQLQAFISSADIAAAGTAQVAVVNPKPSPLQSNSVPLTIQSPPSLQITTNSLPTAVVQLPYSAAVANSGGVAPYTWKVASGQLPPGLAMEATSGAIAGVPGQAGKYSFTAQVTDSSPAPQTASQPLAVSVTAPSPLVISTTSLPNGTVQVAYSATLGATGGTAPYSWGVVSGALPVGLGLNASSGVISGTPSASGQSSFTVQAKDSAASPQTASTALSIVVAASPSVSVAVSPSSSSLQANQTQQFTATVTGTTNTQVTWSTTVAGASIGSTGLFTAPIVSVTTSGTVSAASVADPTKAASASVTVTAPTPPPPPPSSGTFCGGTAGPATLPKCDPLSPGANTVLDTTLPDISSYSVMQVNAGGNLQSTISNASCDPNGTVIKVQAGATFSGHFTLPNKACAAGQWVIIQSDSTSIPPTGTRVAPSLVGFMPTVISPDNAPTFQFNFGANFYRLIGLEITTAFASQTSTDFNIILMGYDALGNQATSTSQLPHDIVFDRCYIHGTATGNIRRGVTLNSARTAILDSYISEIHEVGADSEAFAGWNGTGPFKIVNNFLESGSGVGFGGSSPGIAGLVTADVEMRQNYVFKPLSWRVGDPSYAGINWVVKNHIDLKNVQRMLMDGNVLENNWLAAQNGISVLFTPRSTQSGPQTVLQDVTFTHNIVRHAGGGINLLAFDNEDTTLPAGTIQAHRFYIANNVLEDIGGSWTPGNDPLFLLLLNGPDTITVDHNTVFQTGSIINFDSPIKIPNLVFQNSIMPQNANGVIGGGQIGTGALNQFCSVPYVYAKNVMVTTSSFTYPAGNFFPPDFKTVQFVNYKGGNGGDYHLQATSPYKNAGTDGKDIGADIDAVNAATNGVAVR